MADSAVWLISGCSSGFGRELAAAVLRRGQRVVVTARSLETVKDFARDYPKLALVTALDVTRADQVAAVVRQAEEKFGRIDVLVNNAGYGYLAALEEGEDAEVRAMFEANVFGLIALTKAVLPGMRKRRKGHVVNISSVGGLIGFPGIGYYNATKFAVEGLSEALAKEAQPLGIRVTIVEPGPFRTEWAGRNLRTPKVVIGDYAETAGARREMISGYSGKQPGDPARAAEAIIVAVETPNSPLHLVLGRPAFDAVKSKISEFSTELEKWRSTSLGTDFPRED
ncbi:oxidoreductase [Telmatospirillum siberiense]|uniref:Short-chain dehydrogenase/reductase n=1 Tax=Telmatospirillum siberiense TaxID=382514 RepID=A0A2N3PTX1_9PROT|nr:oxidoreductase [Telmatospirillum siberiense]PKU23836.1 short-chain dehydrogenase/reductase [Telmatospirillum siberiense]